MKAKIFYYKDKPFYSISDSGDLRCRYCSPNWIREWEADGTLLVKENVTLEFCSAFENWIKTCAGCGGILAASTIVPTLQNFEFEFDSKTKKVKVWVVNLFSNLDKKTLIAESLYPLDIERDGYMKTNFIFKPHKTLSGLYGYFSISYEKFIECLNQKISIEKKVKEEIQRHQDQWNGKEVS